MTKLTMEQLIKAANELDALMGLDLLPPVEDEDQEALETWIKDASEELHGDDTVSDETETVLEELNVWIAPEDRVDKEDENEKGTKDNADDDGGGQDLPAEVDAAESLKELREIVKANDEFKSLRGLMTKYKAGSEEDLKEEMLDLLEPDANLEPKEEKKPETKRKTPSGKDEVPIPKKGSAKMKVVPAEKKEKSKEEKKPIEKKEKSEVTMTRSEAIAQAIHSLCKNGATMQEIMEEGDAIYAKAIGKTGSAGSGVNRYFISGLVEFDILTKVDKKYKFNK